MSKQKRPGGRRRRADEKMIIRVSNWEYQQARIRKARETGVDVAMIADRLGRRESIAVGAKRLRKWFHALPDSAKANARTELIARITGDTEAIEAEVVRARKSHADGELDAETELHHQEAGAR